LDRRGSFDADCGFTLEIFDTKDLIILGSFEGWLFGFVFVFNMALRCRSMVNEQTMLRMKRLAINKRVECKSSVLYGEISLELKPD
jgi:hypothetical protein